MIEVRAYLVVENNVVSNTILWDGDNSSWVPPTGATVLDQATTPAKVWAQNQEAQQYELQILVGAGAIGFTWDGSVLTTNEPQPEWRVIPTTVIS